MMHLGESAGLDASHDEDLFGHGYDYEEEYEDYERFTNEFEDFDFFL